MTYSKLSHSELIDKDEAYRLEVFALAEEMIFIKEKLQRFLKRTDTINKRMDEITKAIESIEKEMEERAADDDIFMEASK